MVDYSSCSRLERTATPRQPIWQYNRVLKHRSSVRRIALIVAVGAVLAVTLLLVIYDPTLQLLIFSGIASVLFAILISTWFIKQHLLAWYSKSHPLVRCLLAGCVVWLLEYIYFLIFIWTRFFRYPDFLSDWLLFRTLAGLIGYLCFVLTNPLVHVISWLNEWFDIRPPANFGCFTLNTALGILSGIILNAFICEALFSMILRIKKVHSIDL
jgi:hypothetical protein